MSSKKSVIAVSTSAAILLDEMLSPAIAEQLRQRGVDAVALTEIQGLAGISDEEVLTYAASENRVVVTRNVRDFVVLDRQWRDSGRFHAGIAYLDNQSFRQDRAFVGKVVTALAHSTTNGALPSAGVCVFITS
jgi:predicted nuclease of predicted toxin-antitoxin system